MAEADFTPPVDNDCSDEKNFVDWEYNVFPSHVRAAAAAGALSAFPFMRTLSRAHTIARGLETIFQIAAANEAQRTNYSPGDGEQPPIAITTVEDLTSLGRCVAGMLSEEICRLSGWAEEAIETK